jgi:cytochrome c nitrite reductase small subunit
MNEQYEGWMKSSHRAVATCNDCHMPSNFLGKYATKASNTIT